MNKNVQISMLCEIYGKLLTEKQLDVLTDYYDKDFSLFEIGRDKGITRQAVRDMIKKGENKLFEFEEKLGIMKTRLRQEEKIGSVLAELLKIKDGVADNEVAEILTNIQEELTFLH